MRRSGDDAVAFSGELSEEQPDPPSGILVRLADFSELREPGEYYLQVPGVGRSVDFRIGSDIYDGELANLMLGYYGWRSGIDVEFEHGGHHYFHRAGHLDDALLDYVDDQVGVIKDGTGGWYDAGDYGKYVPTAAVSIDTMLAAWELFSDRLQKVELSFIPEHGSELPDFLSELKWEIDWLLKMAYDDGSGRVHHKINSPSFPSLTVLPADDPTTRYFSGYSTAAIGEFVATLAKAARAFKPYDDVTHGYSVTLLEAALESYAYLEEHPEDVEYDDSVLAAGAYQKLTDRLWAAAELWETTGDDTVLADFESKILDTTSFPPNFDWDATSNFALLTYVLSERDGRDPDIVSHLESELLASADEIVRRQRGKGYGRGFYLYYWGTNGVVARMCMLLQSAYVLDPDPAYLDACTDQIGFLYGRNQYNRSQITGSGIDPPRNPHHRPSASDEVDAPYPGLLVGGGTTATSWRDVQADARNNEVAINWNAALVFALAGFIEGTATASLGRGPVAAEDCGVRLSSVGFLPERSKVATVQEDCALPSDFDCDLPDATSSGDVSGPPSVIDDLEDGDTRIAERDGRQGSWFDFDDGSSGTRSGLELEAVGKEHGTAACISGKDFTRWGGGFGFSLAEMAGQRQSYDASRYTGLSFWAKGSETQFRALLVDNYSDPGAQLCSGCNDHFQAPFTPDSEWQKVTLTWQDFEQQGFGDPQPSVCASNLRAIQFQWPANSDFELCVDDVSFTTPASTATTWSASGGGGCACQLALGQLPSRTHIVPLVVVIGLEWRRRKRKLGQPT